MTDATGPETFTDDIVDEPASATRLDREASAFLRRSERRTFGPTTSVRQAVREDIDEGRQWARARAEAARNVTLQATTTVGGIAMPAGTRLKLQDEGQLETYLEAEFPHPVAMYGVQASSARRYLQSDYDDETYALRGRYPRNVILRGAGEYKKPKAKKSKAREELPA